MKYRNRKRRERHRLERLDLLSVRQGPHGTYSMDARPKHDRIPELSELPWPIREAIKQFALVLNYRYQVNQDKADNHCYGAALTVIRALHLWDRVMSELEE